MKQKDKIIERIKREIEEDEIRDYIRDKYYYQSDEEAWKIFYEKYPSLFKKLWKILTTYEYQNIRVNWLHNKIEEELNGKN